MEWGSTSVQTEVQGAQECMASVSLALDQAEMQEQHYELLLEQTARFHILY